MFRDIILPAFVLFVQVVVPYIDAYTISARIKELTLESKVQCHDYPDKCWIKLKERR